MNFIPNRRHLLAVAAAGLLAGCASLAPPTPTIPVAVDAAPFGDLVPEGYAPIFIETSRDDRFSAIYLAWDWTGGTQPEGPTSLVLLVDHANDQNYELTDFRSQRVDALNWQADDLIRMRTSDGRVYVGLDPTQPGDSPPLARRTNPPSDWAQRREMAIVGGTPNTY